MKRFACLIMLLMLLITSGAYAEDMLQEYRDECPHLFWIMSEDSIMEMKKHGIFEIPALCIYCETQVELILPWTPAYQQTDENRDMEACSHVYRMSEEIVDEGYYPMDQVSGIHEYRYLMNACCENCSEQIDVYNGVGVNRTSAHDYEETGVHFHLDGTQQHVVVRRCKDCGFVFGSVRKCTMFDIGLCTTTLREMGQLQIPDWYYQIGK